MKRHWRWFVAPLIFGVAVSPLILAIRFYLAHVEWFHSAGTIAKKEHELMLIAVSLMLLVIIPVIGLAIWFAWWYRAGNKKAQYTPDWDHAKTDELIWWSIPLEIVLVLAALTWTTTRDLDPWKPLASEQEPLTVEVVALDWKWLFIYPEEGVASVNELEIPVNTPINFKLTADAPMNSFWIPRLGGQIMAMTGMVTKLHLIATQEGTFQGRSANFSGSGFSGMQFDVHSVSKGSFDAWVQTVQNSGAKLDSMTYNELAQPSEDVAPKAYVLAQPDLFESIVHTFMMPMQTGAMQQMEHTMQLNPPQTDTATATETATTTDVVPDLSVTPPTLN